MSGKHPSSRVLPLTITAMAVLLAIKAVDFGHMVLESVKPATLMVTEARAAGPEKAPEKAPEKVPEKAPEKAPDKATEKAGEPSGEHKSAATSAPPGVPNVAPQPPPPPSAEPPIPESERIVLMELRLRRTALDARDAALAARESMLAAAEKKIDARVAELTALQKRLEALEAGRSEREEASWQGLVKVYETMKPRDAAAIFNELDKSVLLGVLDRMKDQKAALVLAAMTPDKAREVTAQLAQIRSQRNAPLGASPSTPPATASKAAGAPG